MVDPKRRGINEGVRKAEGRRQKSEVRSQKSEIRNQNTELRTVNGERRTVNGFSMTGWPIAGRFPGGRPLRRRREMVLIYGR